MGWGLAVDVGTSNTGAATRRPDGTGARVVAAVPLSRHHVLMPSGVLRDETGLVTGEYARNQAASEPDGSYEPNPKTRILLGEQQIHLGGHDIEVADAVAAILSEVARTAARRHANQPPAGLVLTHPAGWGARRTGVLVDAAGRAGLPAPLLVAEPEAAAAYYAATHRADPGAILGVYDLGGGTLDLALLQVENDGTFHLLDNAGDDDCGGEKFDRALHGWVAAQLDQAGRPDHLDQLGLADQLTLRDAISRAKERLSDHATAKIAVPGHPDPLVVTRNEFEPLVADDITRSVQLLASLLERNQLTPDQLTRLYLTGGSSPIPLVATTLTSQLGMSAVVGTTPLCWAR
jgi:molecular chaperone DnaK (HSP70)